MMVVATTMMFLLDEPPKELSNEICAVGILRDVGWGATGGIVRFTLPHLPASPCAPRQRNGPGDVECSVKTWWWWLVDEQSTEENMYVQSSLDLAPIIAGVGGEAWVGSPQFLKPPLYCAFGPCGECTGGKGQHAIELPLECC